MQCKSWCPDLLWSLNIHCQIFQAYDCIQHTVSFPNVDFLYWIMLSPEPSSQFHQSWNLLSVPSAFVEVQCDTAGDPHPLPNARAPCNTAMDNEITLLCDLLLCIAVLKHSLEAENMKWSLNSAWQSKFRSNIIFQNGKVQAHCDSFCHCLEMFQDTFSRETILEELTKVVGQGIFCMSVGSLNYTGFKLPIYLMVTVCA